jgi:hypothetical protein
MVEVVMSSESVKEGPHLQWFHSFGIVLQMADEVAAEVSGHHRWSPCDLANLGVRVHLAEAADLEEREQPAWSPAS